MTTSARIYGGFVEMVASSGSTAPTYWYGATSGYKSDGDAGLTHVGARYYDASVGRFITRDTDISQKPYNYCEGDPINATDPSGHWWWNHVNGGDFWGTVGTVGSLLTAVAGNVVKEVVETKEPNVILGGLITWGGSTTVTTTTAAAGVTVAPVVGVVLLGAAGIYFGYQLGTELADYYYPTQYDN